MNTTSKAAKVLSLMLSVAAFSACGKSKNSNDDDTDTQKKTTVAVPRNTGSATTTPARPAGGSQSGTNPPVSACSSNYEILGTANPFLAGAPSGTELDYGRAPLDAAPLNAPVSVQADDVKCFDAGRRLYFQVAGRIAYDAQPDIFTDADGQPNNTPSHTLGSVHGLSNITAPINSLVGVFLDNTPFASRAAAPEALDFSSVASRNFKTLTPKLGQIFFIGDGKDASGLLQAFVVPAGTTRLYLAIMDQYEWSNNQGQLSGTIQWVKP
ncbi:MAG TPA: hypothetical protein VFO10_09440 [Oligoflexus sp.]|uniref:hypothetical protein n=1 Tax=Oligoflexus sp. TaxID=1971216 RepID=UPI002D7F454C|nr:hypothetical protein [Oligoflexus sp.]HET9237461.1 hypothetical protein [Oligoflexus sp.]